MMRILLATDGRPAAAGAVRLARSLAMGEGAMVQIVKVIEPPSIYGEGWSERIAYACEHTEEGKIHELRSSLRSQLEAYDSTSGWPITIAIGPAPRSIVEAAKDFDASLIVLGIGRHKRADRWFGTETALRVIRLAHVPVLAVPEQFAGRPANAVIAMDFSEFSRDAAGIAAMVTARGGTLHLAHVIRQIPTDSLWITGKDWDEKEHERVTSQLEAARELLGADEAHRVAVHLLEGGDPASEILNLAERTDAQLVSAGSHGAGFLSRLVAGSVSTRILRASEKVTLIAPPRAGEKDEAEPVLAALFRERASGGFGS